MRETREAPTDVPPQEALSRRERQIMDVVYQRGRCTAQEILEALPSPPSYSAVRALLRILEEKKHLRHELQGASYVYSPTLSPEKARQSAVHRLVETFFQGSLSQAAMSLLDLSRPELTAAELDRLSQLIENCRKEGR
jgi:predicted transcriptional regulator